MTSCGRRDFSVVCPLCHQGETTLPCCVMPWKNTLRNALRPFASFVIMAPLAGEHKWIAIATSIVAVTFSWILSLSFVRSFFSHRPSLSSQTVDNDCGALATHAFDCFRRIFEAISASTCFRTTFQTHGSLRSHMLRSLGDNKLVTECRRKVCRAASVK